MIALTRLQLQILAEIIRLDGGDYIRAAEISVDDGGQYFTTLLFHTVRMAAWFRLIYEHQGFAIRPPTKDGWPHSLTIDLVAPTKRQKENNGKS